MRAARSERSPDGPGQARGNLLTGDPHLAEDLAQTALVPTYAAWRRVRREDALAYARRTLVNADIDRLRRRHLTELPGVEVEHLGTALREAERQAPAPLRTWRGSGSAGVAAGGGTGRWSPVSASALAVFALAVVGATDRWGGGDRGSVNIDVTHQPLRRRASS